MLNKNDPLIGAVQEVMKRNQTERETVKVVNEYFGIQDRKVLPHERQGEWNSVYQKVLSEGVEFISEDELNDKDKGQKKKSSKYKHKTSGKEIMSMTHPGKEWDMVNEELKGDQPKIDANRNGEVDGGDFKLLKKGVRPVAEEQIDEVLDSDEAKTRYVSKTAKEIDDFNPKGRNANAEVKGVKKRIRGLELLKRKMGKEQSSKNVKNVMGLKEEPTDNVGKGENEGGSAVTVVKKPAPKPTSVTPSQQGSLTNMIKKVMKEAQEQNYSKDPVGYKSASQQAAETAGSQVKGQTQYGRAAPEGGNRPSISSAAANLNKPAIIPPGTNNHNADLGNATSGGPSSRQTQSSTAPNPQDRINAVRRPVPAPAAGIGPGNKPAPSVAPATPAVKRVQPGQPGSVAPATTTRTNTVNPNTQTAGPNRGLPQKPAAPTSTAPKPKARPAAPNTAARPKAAAPKVTPVRKAPPTAPAKPKMSPLQQQMARSKTGRDDVAGPRKDANGLNLHSATRPNLGKTK